MKCPYCANPESKVVDSRPADEGNSIRRRRECLECHRRFTTYETMESVEKIADEIEQTLQGEMDREVPTSQIGEMVMDRLKGVDEVAYVRFASVYRQFKDINTFMDELSKLLAEK